LKKLAIILLSVFFFFPACLSAQNSSPEEMFKKSFPKNNFETITPTKIKGVYEVYTGNQVYYYMPEAEVILAGKIITKDGIDLTRESNLSKIAKKMATLPLDDAFKVGNGKTKVVEFMDPNCYHCRLAYNFFSKRKDVTLYVFFFPLSQDSDKKIRHIFCAKNKLKTYEDVMSGKLDNNAPLNICTDKKVDETVKTHLRLASQTGIRATPLFYIKGQVVDGFEPAVIEKLLNE
jgi:thiol:disulfide interchange protein DsbC